MILLFESLHVFEPSTHSHISQGLLNYRWAQVGLADSTELGVASLISLLCFGAGGYYGKNGDKGTLVALSVAGALQAVGARSAM